MFLTSLIHALPGLIFCLDKKGCFQLCNKKYELFIGLNQENLKNKSIFDVLPQEIAEKLNAKIQKAFVNKKQINYIKKIKEPSRTIFFQVKILPFSFENQDVVLVIEEDITKQKIANIKRQQDIQHLKNAKSYLENIIGSFPASVYWKDKEGHILGDNLIHAKMAGFRSQADVIGKTDFDFPWKNQALQIRENDNQVMKTKKTQTFEEIGSLSEDSTNVFLTIKTPLFNRFKKVSGVIGISMDITELKKAQKAAEAANSAKSEFLRNMEHSLRTPFSGVYSLALIVVAQLSEPAVKELVEYIAQSGEELLVIINDIIEFSRNEISSGAVLAKKFDLKRLIEKTIIIEKPATISQQLQINYHYPAELPTVFISDPKRIQGILLHILSNSIKFTPKGSIQVDVKLGKQIDEKNYILQILVTDTGIGIAKENQEFIYERFYRASPANHNKYSGAGLGLSAVKRLIDDLEGEIDVVSELGQGSTFICTLSLKRPLLDEIVEEKPVKKYSTFLQNIDKQTTD